MKKTKFSIDPMFGFERGGKAALQAAVRSLWSRDDRRMIVVTGPRGCGKGKLVSELIAHFFGRPRRVVFPVGEDEMQRLLPAVLLANHCWFDDPPERWNSRSLELFLSSTEWTFRPLYLQKLETLPIFTRLFLTTCFEPSESIARLSIVIRLKGGEA